MYKVSSKCYLCNGKMRAMRTLINRRKCISSVNKDELDRAYLPQPVESHQDETYFRPPLRDIKPYTLILPPPNITGTLHLGHALTATVEDILVRWHRMRGIETTWIPGIDHAGIATQVVVEKKLWQEEGKTRNDIGRERFVEKVWQWKAEKSLVIGKQLRCLGLALNWECQSFTMDDRHSKAVTEAFIRLFEAGMIYRGNYLVNWSCVLQSAVSDIEVESLEVDGPTAVPVPGYDTPVEFGVLYKIAYKVKDWDEEVVIATTRPETLLGDVAVAIHPEDGRHSHLLGRHLWHPFRNRPIPVITDPFVDPKFGTGAVKISPAHDRSDFEVGKRHSLEPLQVIDETGRLTPMCGEFRGFKRFDARRAIVDRLDQLGLLRGRDGHKMVLPICSRTRDVIELLVRPQWFLKCAEMAARALKDVKEGRLSIQPPQFEKQWFNWLESSRDWCISRQLWWGHRIPAYLCSADDDPSRQIWVAAEDRDAARRKAAEKLGVDGDAMQVKRDEDVLDTWFSSGLQPLTVFGWPEQTADLSKHYPISLMETGHDILFFWVARMAMLCTHLTNRLPFELILLHGIVCDAHGRKMSKSLGNVVAPEDVIEGRRLEDLQKVSKASHAAGILSEEELKLAIHGQKVMFPQGIPECGADALRFTLASHNIKNHFINFDVSECHTNKLFCNKIWQATKFTKLWFTAVSEFRTVTTPLANLTLMDQWILSRLSNMVSEVNEALAVYNFHVATAELKNFLYYNLCDVYLESTKRGLRSPDSFKAVGHCWTLVTCLDVGVRALAPFMPALAQHLHQRLPLFEGRTRNVDFPDNLEWTNKELEENVEQMLQVVVAIRRLKKVFSVTAKHKPEVFLLDPTDRLSNFADVIEDLSASNKMRIVQSEQQIPHSECVKDALGDTTIYLVVSDEQRKAVQLDVPAMENKRQKLLVELDRARNTMVKRNLTPEGQAVHRKKVAMLEEKLSRITYIQNLVRR